MPHPVDRHVGQRIRQRRWQVGVTQGQLAEKVGIRFQQIQKYETGANRVSASRLWDIAEVLDVPVSYFFEDMDEGPPPDEAGFRMSAPRAGEIRDKEAMDLVRSYYAIPPSQRRRLFDLARVLSSAA